MLELSTPDSAASTPATAAITAQATNGQRSHQRQRGTSAYAMPAIAASGANTTTTWTMSGWRGSPLISMGW